MKSLQLTKHNKLHYADTAESPIQAGEVRLKVNFCGICRTDAKMYFEGQRDLRMPRILGHEFSGTDSDGRTFAVWPAKSCERCEQCKSGHENLCPNIEIIGFHRDGAMAEYVTVPEKSLIELPVDLPPQFAIFAEPMACGINALQQIKSDCKFNKHNDSNHILIIGGGTCGLLTALVAKTYGLNVTVLENSPEKIHKSKVFAESSNIDIVAHIPEKRHFNYCINATASLESLTTGIKLLKSSGTFSLFSGFSKNDAIPANIINEIHYRQLNITGAYGCTKLQMSEALQIINRNQNIIESLIEKSLKLEEVEKTIPAVFAGETFRYIIKNQESDE